MTGRRLTLITAAGAVIATVATGLVMLNRWREVRHTGKELQAEVLLLRTERDRLRAEVASAVSRDTRLTGGPERPLRIGIPTTLAHEFVSTLVAGVANEVTLELVNLNVRKRGSVRKVVLLGDWDLKLRVTRVTAKLGVDAPELLFGGNQVRLSMPVRVESGTGSAEVDFLWQGRKLGSVCGDMQLKEVVTGTVMPAVYRLAGTLQLSTSDEAIMVTPRLPALRVRVRVVPSKASRDLVQKTLDAKRGMCGFVIDRSNIPESLEGMLARGFDVRLPIEKLRPMALPVGFAQTLTVRGIPVALGVSAGDLVITSDMIWFGAQITMRPMK
ncbi:MAG: hypothetical protein ABIP90_01455 [Vicinamibacterales bacterium]